MVNGMTNVQRLQEWVDTQGEDLVDINLFLNPTKDSTVEEICGSVLKMLDNKDKGLYTRIASAGKEVSVEVTDLVTDNFEELLA